MNKLLLLPFIILLAVVHACKPERQEIFYGEEECAHCSMIISNPQYSSQLLTVKGRHYNFDAIECLSAFIESGNMKQEEIHSLWVRGFNDEEWVPAEQAHFLKSRNLVSPMSLNISAYCHRDAAEEYQRNHSGEILAWA
ncbi:MAG: nitrous oxide reductase accessory protein NosL, partial [Balneolales bacterium]